MQAVPEVASMPLVSGDRARESDSAAVQRAAFAQAVIRGLSARPRSLDCRYLYDAHGSALFDRITRLPEYYLSRAESEILARSAARIRDLVGAGAVAELGAGSAVKTRLLLDAWLQRGPATYVPIDISREHLAVTCAALRQDLPQLAVCEIAGSYEQALPRLAAHSPLCLLFLGSSIGNLTHQQTDVFLASLGEALAGGDHFLLGVDLVKDVGSLERAYADSAGVTARFLRNLFARMNRELGTAIDLDAIEHVAYFNREMAQMEISARFRRATDIDLAEYGRRFRIGPGEAIHIEISRKFDLERNPLSPERYGFESIETFRDEQQRFALLLWRRRAKQTAASSPVRIMRQLDAVRAQTLRLIAPLTDQQLTCQHNPLMSPMVWDLGHIANYEEQWIARALYGNRRLDRDAPRNDSIYDSARHPRVRRAELALLDRDGALRFLQATRDAARVASSHCEAAQPNPLLDSGYVFAMVAQHEAQHAETMLQAIQLIAELHYEPYWRRDREELGRPSSVEVLIPAGPFVMGSDDRSCAYDNERPAHVVELPAYFIDEVPVTNRDFLGFVEDGGYQRPELWSPEGRAWLAQSGAAHPQQWRRLDGIWQERHFGREVPLRLWQPVVHVSWFEADAFARWAGKRLPTEAEWEKVAAWDLERGGARRYPWGDQAPSSSLANLGQETFAPAEVGTLPAGASFYGCEQMIGDVWEWTASEFAPYPGFEMFPYAEYSATHFGKGYKVLRGGSWATNAVAIRNTFRNWDHPQRRQIFAGFRCARSVE